MPIRNRHTNPPATNGRFALGVLGLALVLLAGGWWVWGRSTSVTVNGQSCATADIQDQLTAADLVLTGSVFAVLPAATGADVIIAPDRLYRGRLTTPSPRIAALADQTGADTKKYTEGELHFASGQGRYLLFLHARSDGRYDTRACFGSRLLTKGLSPEETSALGAGTPVAE